MALIRSTHPGTTARQATHPSPGAIGEQSAHPVAPGRSAQADVRWTRFLWAGRFDRARLAKDCLERFTKVPRFDAASLPNLEQLVGFIESDPNLVDIRQMAYLLATAYWETAHAEAVVEPGRGHPRGRPPGARSDRRGGTMQPIRGAGRGVGLPDHRLVKLSVLPNGDVRVTEQDGDQFRVSRDGSARPLNRGAVRGASDQGPVALAYLADNGKERRFYGRGYVQLTWWNNYATSGAGIGLGLRLLIDPDQADDPPVAYKLLSYCMRTGKGFANGHRLNQYIAGSRCAYVGARAIVNGQDHALDIAAIAQHFEAVLYDARRLDGSIP